MQSHTRQITRHQVIHAWVNQPLIQLVLGPQEELEQAWQPRFLLLQSSSVTVSRSAVRLPFWDTSRESSSY